MRFSSLIIFHTAIGLNSKQVRIVKKNSGLSLIELVVVIAIMAVVSAGVSIAVFSQSSWRCRQANDLVFNMLQQTRSEALARSDAWIEICYEDGQCVLKSSFDEDQALGKRVEVFYEYQKGQTADSSSGTVPINSSNRLVLTFKRGTGGFQTMKEGVSVDSSTGVVTYTEASSKGNAAYCRAIHVKGKGSSKGYTITLHPVTGKFESKKDQ